MTQVRQFGLFIGVDLDPRVDCRGVVQRCFDDGLLVLTCAHSNTIRLLPPLNVTERDVERACASLLRSI